MIIFTNSGEIDIRSITSFGVSVKEGENPIGFFGTGLKYAIAVLLRTGHEVTVLVGATALHFDTQRESIRGKEFDFVRMTEGNTGQMLGFTTELGKQWEVWMAYRELACNAKDEKGLTLRADATPEPQAGITQVIVRGDAIEAAHAERHLYLLEDEPAFVVGKTEVRRRHGPWFYYRGVRVANLGQSGVFTYNSLGQMTLTEDRTLKHEHEAMQAIRRAVMKADNAEFIEACVTAPKHTLEADMDFHGWGIDPSPTFLQVVGDLMADRPFDVNLTAAKVWREATKQPFSPNEITLTKVQLMTLNRALDFTEKIGFKIRGAYPIKVIESLGEGGLGLAQDGTIFLAERVFHLGGTKQVASTLIEEYVHLRHGWKDLTRELQSFLFDKLVSVGEELVGEPL